PGIQRFRQAAQPVKVVDPEQTGFIHPDDAAPHPLLHLWIAQEGLPIATEQKTTILVQCPGFTASVLLETRPEPPDSRKPIREWLSRTRNSQDRTDSTEVVTAY